MSRLPVSKATPEIQAAFDEVKKFFPDLQEVHYGEDLRWCYRLRSGQAPIFPKGRVDVYLLEQGADSLTCVPVTFFEDRPDLPLQDKRSPAEKAEAIQRYEEYWARNAAHNHHEIDCPNTTGCDHRLKIARPAKGSGEMWDSLATCPYCNGAFFYESRPLRIDAAFKGFI